MSPGAMAGQASHAVEAPLRAVTPSVGTCDAFRWYKSLFAWIDRASNSCLGFAWTRCTVITVLSSSKDLILSQYQFVSD